LLWILALPFIGLGTLFVAALVPFVLLPFAVLAVPFLLFRVLIKATMTLFILPMVLLGALVAVVVAIAFSFAIVAPLIPFLLVAWFVWAVLKPRSPAATAVRG